MRHIAFVAITALLSVAAFIFPAASASASVVPAVGATVSQGYYPGTDRITAAQQWDDWVGRPMATTMEKMYLQAGQEPSGPDKDMRQLAAAGSKLLISIKPPAPGTPAGKAWVVSYMQALKAAGINADITLWQEPINAAPFPSASSYISYVRYYASSIRPYYPLVYNPNVNPQTIGKTFNKVTAFYPGNAYIDKIEVDDYCTAWRSGTRMDSVEALANKGGKPFGWAEWGIKASAASSSCTIAQFQQFANYIVSVFQSRAAAGLVNGDVLYYNGIDNVVTGPGDPKVPVIQGVYDALA